jgi:thioesterase domain-containing protein
MADIPSGSEATSTFPELKSPSNHYRPPRTIFDYQLLEIWQRLTGRTNFGIDDHFLEVGRDSPLIDQLMVEVETITHQPLPPLVRTSAHTIRQLADAVLRANSPSEAIMTRAKDGLRTPFFFCHGDYAGRGFYALKLADMLHADQPVFLLHSYINPDSASTIKEMAKCFVSQLMVTQPIGAFRLGGFCNGGLLAWEIASQIENCGREVETIVLVDTISLNARFFMRQFVRLINIVSPVVPARFAKALQTGLFFLRDSIRDLSRDTNVVFLDRLRHIRSLWKHRHNRIRRLPTAKFIPARIKAAVVVVLCKESRHKVEYASSPWDRLAPRTHCRYIDGTHLGSVTTHIGELASLLDELLVSTRGIPGRFESEGFPMG